MTKLGNITVGTKNKITIMGILNTSPESFYKNSIKSTKSQIAKHVTELEETGANIIVANYLSKVNINPFIITNGAYYFYNYIAQSIPPSKCFILA